MSGIKSLGIAVPERAFSVEDIRAGAGRWLHDSPGELALFERFLYSSKNERRFLSVSIDEILELGGPSARAKLFEERGPAIATQAAESALAEAGVDPSEIRTLLFTSCTAPLIPSIDGIILDRLGLNRSVRRIPIYQHGCAGGVIGLALASNFAKSDGPVLLCSTELCSLVFHRSDTGGAHLVGSAIFGDGAAAAVVLPEPGKLELLDAQSYLLPNTRHLMGYDIHDDGAHLRLDRELPSALVGSAPKLVDGFLAKHDLTRDDIGWWLFHPGGPKILDALEAALKIDPEQAIWSRDVLRQYANLSSATVLFVTKLFLESKVYRPGQKVLLLGVGPGLTIEMILMETKG